MTNNKPYDLIVFIGRCEPFHLGHKEIIDYALTLSDDVIILIGSSFQPRTIKNPWTFEDRKFMINKVYSNEMTPRVIAKNFFDSSPARPYLTVEPLQDYRPDNNIWAARVQSIVAERARKLPWQNYSPKIRIIGCDKDETSFYLNLFPQWEPIKCPLNLDIHATKIRENYFENRDISNESLMPPVILTLLEQFKWTDTYKTLKDEWEFIKGYRRQWAGAPYAVNFVTVDAVVIQSGCVLLVERRASPGKGLWALPGGFLNTNERIRDAALRELKEETKIDVPLKVLLGNVVGTEVFDDPQRSLRGRTITHAVCIKLPAGKLPKVKGSDDAMQAKWVPLAQVREDELFEDHYQVIQTFVGRFN